jgi:hypothetical protein
VTHSQPLKLRAQADHLVSPEGTMKIRDPYHLIPDHEMVHRIVKSHPFYPYLPDKIREVKVLPLDHDHNQWPRVEYDQVEQEVKLYVAPNTASRSNYDYILYHEFSHVADRLNPAFGYSDEIRFSLSGNEQINVMELWNAYIDARLHHHGLFKLGENDKNVHCMINGKLQELPFSIEGKLMAHTSFLSSRGLRDAQGIVLEIWDDSNLFRSYQDLVAIVKTERS